jgi:hypothetical protein
MYKEHKFEPAPKVQSELTKSLYQFVYIFNVLELEKTIKMTHEQKLSPGSLRRFCALKTGFFFVIKREVPRAYQFNRTINSHWIEVINGFLKRSLSLSNSMCLCRYSNLKR